MLYWISINNNSSAYLSDNRKMEMKKELENRIKYLKDFRDDKNFLYETKGLQMEVEEKIEYLEKLLDAMSVPC